MPIKICLVLFHTSRELDEELDTLPTLSELELDESILEVELLELVLSELVEDSLVKEELLELELLEVSEEDELVDSEEDDD